MKTRDKGNPFSAQDGPLHLVFKYEAIHCFEGVGGNLGQNFILKKIVVISHVFLYKDFT